jgi:tetratricopeptide (TPR) repeat protein
MKQTVPADIVARMNEKNASAREARQRGDSAEAEKCFLEAWSLLPEPKIDYDYAQSLSRVLVNFYRDTGQSDKAKKWLEVMRQAYGPEPDPSVEFMAGTVYFEAGELDAAFKIFDALHKKFKQRPFQGKDEKYLEFYKKRAAVAK